MSVVFTAILCVMIVLLLIIILRGLLFTSGKQAQGEQIEAEIDENRAVENLQQLIRCKTVSYEDRSLEDDAAFEKLFALLPTLYPNVFSSCEQIEMHKRALLFLWKGEEHGKKGAEASVLMAHFDVVPVEEENWEKPPFEGIIEDGVLWGRGAIDTKVTFNGILTAANELIGQGFTPKNDIYLAFSGGEETNGPGASDIVAYFQKNDIKLSMVLDEGGAVVENVFPGVKEQCALIGIAEKGMLNLKYSVNSNGGHASAPGPHTPVGVLADAVKKVEDQPLTMHITPPVAQMFDTLGRKSTFLYRVIFANLWCFKGVLNILTKKSGGELNALVRTTVAFTQMQASKAANVIPPSASVVSNIRINPDETIESVIADIRQRIANPDITLESVGTYAMNPSPVSRTDVEGWERVVKAVKSTWTGVIVSPYLMVQCSDARHYRDISDRVYRFSAMHLTKEERSLIHGNNERVTLREIGQATRFFYRLIKLS